MVKSYSLHTSEIDIAQEARDDILQQLGQVPLLQNSVGIIVCHYDFVDNGIVALLAEALPFPLVGFTTFYQATPKTNGLFELSITILTSDDVRFAVSCSTAQEREDAPQERVEHAYRAAFQVHGEAPAAIMSFLSVNRPVSGDEYLRLLDACSGGVPGFGGITTGDDETGANVYVICKDEVFSEGFAMLLIIGEVDARFYSGHYREDKLLEMTATVTKATGVVVKQLNQQPATEFLDKNGIAINPDGSTTLLTVPFLHRRPGETALVARTMGGYNQAGEALFFGEIPEGSLFRIGTASTQDILMVSRGTLEKALEDNENASVLLLFSCVGRFMALGLETTSEMDFVTDSIPQGLPYLAAYVGGEICPVVNNGKAENRYLNSSFVVFSLS